MRWALGMVAVIAWSAIACGKKDEPASPAGAPEAAAPAGDAAPAGKTIDLTDNKEVERVALESLQAYRDKNLEQLAALGPPGARDKLIFLEPRNPNYETLLGDGSWRMKALKAWDGKLKKIARGLEDNALCYFHEDEANQYAVEVRKDDGRWYFFDLRQQPKAGAAPTPTPTP